MPDPNNAPGSEEDKKAEVSIEEEKRPEEKEEGDQTQKKEAEEMMTIPKSKWDQAYARVKASEDKVKQWEEEKRVIGKYPLLKTTSLNLLNIVWHTLQEAF